MRKVCITSGGAFAAPGMNPGGDPRPAANARIDRWIRRELRRAPLKAQSLVITVWGDAIAPHGGVVWLSGLIRLLAPFGLNERLVRTSVYRLAREGWLVARQDGRRSLYRLTAQGRQRFEHAYRRIYAPPAQDWDGSWEVVLAPGAALTGRARQSIRRELGWEGFGTLGSAVFVRPARSAVPGALAEILAAHDLRERLVVLAGRDAPGLATRSLQAYVRECWDLAGVAAEYRAFLARFAAVSRHFGNGGSADPGRCFIVRSLLIHAFRRVTLHDPQLPAVLLPPRWPAAAAYALCRDFYLLTQRPAEQHLLATLSAAGGVLPPAAAYFYRRFGGLAPAPTQAKARRLRQDAGRIVPRTSPKPTR